MNRSEIEVRLAAGFHARGLLQRAVEGYRRVLAEEPAHLAARLGLARLWAEQSRGREAASLCRQGLALNPGQEELHKAFIELSLEEEGIASTWREYDLRRRDTQELEVARGEVVAVTVIRNEAWRLPFFLDYYRGLGVTRFFFVDNDSSDASVEYLLRQNDVHVWSSGLSFNRANFGSAWFELLLRRYCLNRWCLIVDSDEFLVYPGCESRPLDSLCRDLDSQGKRALEGLLLEMYSDRPLQDTRGENLLEVCPFFDRDFYHQRIEQGGLHKNQTVYLGGARARVFGTEVEYFLSKVPLQKYGTDILLAGGQHWTNLRPDCIASESCALLHMKYVASLAASVDEQVERAEHYAGAAQYKSYQKVLSRESDFSMFDAEKSVRYEGSGQLVGLGIIREGSGDRTPLFPAVPAISLKERPFWSVFITVHGRTQFLERAVCSVLAQATADMRVEIVQDGGVDHAEVAALAHGWGVQFTGLEKNFGQPEIFNECLRRSTGEWIHILHDDDWIEPNFYTSLRAATLSTNVGAAFCRHIYSSQKGPGRLSPLERESPGIIQDWIRRIAVFCRVQAASMVVKRAAYEAVGGYCREAGSAWDWEMWMRLANQFAVYYEPQALAHFYEHDQSLSAGFIRSGQQLRDSGKAIDVARGYLSRSLSEQADRHYAAYGLGLVRQTLESDPAAAWSNLAEVLRLDRSSQIMNELQSFA